VHLTSFELQQQQEPLRKPLCNGCTTKKVKGFAPYFPERKNHARTMSLKMTIPAVTLPTGIDPLPFLYEL
jgi:hypothetical protein